MATGRRRVGEDGAGGISRSQLKTIQEVLEGGVEVEVAVGSSYRILVTTACWGCSINVCWDTHKLLGHNLLPMC